jgi:hypothetical protein
VEPRAAAAADLGGHRVDREAAVAPALLPGVDVQPPQPGAEEGAVAVPADVEERHEEPTGRPPSVISRGQATPGRTYASASDFTTGETACSWPGRTRMASAASMFRGVISSSRGAGAGTEVIRTP